MHVFAYVVLLISMLISLFAGGLACVQAWKGREDLLPWMERGHLLQALLITVDAAILFWAFAVHDFSFLYVADYSDRFLPLFYSITAFWAGQDGSLLFWAWVAVLFGAIFQLTPSYRNLAGEVKVRFWLFYMTVIAFFLLLLTTMSNPFIEVVPAPADGNGLNPLLQNPGMIFHPPLLFLGYAGFTIPACLALAEMITPASIDAGSWLKTSRNYILLSWTFLTAGIILGGWWSYMELGWGGYWAWDPVENASLIPWFTATALLHTSVAENRRGSLKGTNVFLVALTLLMSFFATYLVRSGVIDSLHAFGGNSVGKPLLIFILTGLALTGLILFLGRKLESRPLSDLISRSGLLVVTVWTLLILGLVVLVGTMWPVISRIWSSNPVGLEVGFYNRVCPPFFALIALMLAACPWLGWKSGLSNKTYAAALGGLFILTVVVLWTAGITLPVALLAAASAVTVGIGSVLVITVDPAVRKVRQSIAAHGVHFGLACVVLGIAVSGPYQTSREAVLAQGESMTVGKYEVTYNGIIEENTPAMAYVEAQLAVKKNGEQLGELKPQRRLYRKFPDPFAEASVISEQFGLGNEVYATLLAVTPQNKATVKIGLHPMVNWLWIGGTIMCLFPFLGLRRHKASGGAQ